MLFRSDNPEMVELITTILEKAGYEVISSDDARRALSLIEHVQPHLIISDIVMPSMTGYEFLKQLRNDSRYQSIPFIFLSALSKPEELNFGLNLGADYYLSKPVNIHTLLHRVKRIFSLLQQASNLTQESIKGFTGNLEALSVSDLLQILEL